MRLLLVSIIALMCLFHTSSCKKTEADNEAIDALPENTVGATGKTTLKTETETVQYVSVRAKDGNVWLQQNLGAVTAATSIKDSLALGDLYQWGRWNDGHQKRNPEPKIKQPFTLPHNNPSGLPLGGQRYFIATWWTIGNIDDTWESAIPTQVSDTSGCDPCKKFGNGWRLPTIEEWTTVIEAENITDNISAYNSYLKIIPAGWRSTKNTFLNGVGNATWFWSSTASTANAAFGIQIHSDKVFFNYSDSRSHGASVRCIYK
jgi:uncharacterized protein (TIGR02145 family)